MKMSATLLPSRPKGYGTLPSRSRLSRLLLLSVLLAAVFAFSSGFVPGQKVYDLAGLLTDTQKTTLQAECLRVAQAEGVDVILLSADDAGGRSAMEVADDFYDENAFVYDAPHGTGILMLIDMDNREAWISTSGEAITYFTDARIERVLDSVFEYLPSGDYFQSFQAFLADVEYYMGLPPDSGNGGYYPPSGVTQSPWWTSWILQGGVALLAGVIKVVILITLAGGVMTTGNRDYMSGVRMHASSYTFLRKGVTARVIPKITCGGGGSSTHTSGGGFSHGGGGRGF